MTFKYLTKDLPEVFRPLVNTVGPILLNPNDLKFMLIAEPGLDELALAVEDYGLRRLHYYWSELMKQVPKKRFIKMFQASKGRFSWVEQSRMQVFLGDETVPGFLARLETIALDEQRELANKLKPSSIAEMCALYRDTQYVDQKGFSYLSRELSSATSAYEFFGALTDSLFQDISRSDYKLGTPRLGFHQGRVFEFLGMALSRNWLLFPFVVLSSGKNEQRGLLHRSNVQHYLNPAFCSPEVTGIREELVVMRKTQARTTHAASERYVQYLQICSTYRTLKQGSYEFFGRCLELAEHREGIGRFSGFARRAYNALTKLQNGKHPDIPQQKLHFLKKQPISLAEFSSFEHFQTTRPPLAVWARRFSEFVQSEVGSPQMSQIRKTACTDFSEFLLKLKEPPALPQLITRSDINDYSESGPTFRNFLRLKYSSPGVCNGRLAQMGQFFDYVRDRLRAEHHDQTREPPWFPNPVDIKFDRFSEETRAGTKRKAIGASVLEEMRSILIEDDYAWPKQFKKDWVYLVNEDTKQLEFVWCPSCANCLYFLLSLPVRGTQSRILDSGEGDVELFDFKSRKMIANPRQLPVDGMYSKNRREGAIQVMPSGLLAEPDVVGLWIGTSKTSEHGYPIPWISDELLVRMQHQREWIFRYAHHPNMHSVSDALGHRNTPTELHDEEPKFYPLFRDPSAETKTDNSLPVAKQKLLRMWGALCLEAQQRMNSRATDGSNRIQLVRPGSEKLRYPIALHDIHSLRVSGITDLLDRGVPLNIVAEYVAGHATYIMALWYDKPSPGAIRKHLQRAHDLVADSEGAIPQFNENEIQAMRPFLLSNSDFKGLYTGFDALDANLGLSQVRLAGICPGTRCEEGGLTENGRATSVPAGDRGPSCPQCRFFLTGPAFLLGQVIEGNQLIWKIRKKVQGLERARARILDAEDGGDTRLADLHRSNADVEERQLNDMLTEWWHRMRYYEASIQMLDGYIQFKGSNVTTSSESQPISLVVGSIGPLQFGYNQATELELNHFLTTCAELLPEFSSESIGARQDIELAVGKFLAINDDRELISMFFKLTDEQRLSAANLSVELLLRAAGSPLKAQDLLEGKTPLKGFPKLEEDMQKLFEPRKPSVPERKPKVLKVKKK